jgi:bacillithiol biosynthesis deacetylase BshB1
MPNALNSVADQPLDLLAIFAHPDDAELQVGGTLALAVKHGRRAGSVTLTRGETATRGTPETRAQEAARAARILGLAHHECLDLGDGDLANTQARRIAVVEAIRRLRPRVVLINGLDNRHPDHRRAHELARDAVFLANVGGFAAGGERWLVEAVAWPSLAVYEPDPPADWVVDIGATWETKMAAVAAYGSQVRAAADDPNPTYVASAGFLEQVERRARSWGHLIGAEYGEALIVDRPLHAGHALVRLLGE